MRRRRKPELRDQPGWGNPYPALGTLPIEARRDPAYLQGEFVDTEQGFQTRKEVEMANMGLQKKADRYERVETSRNGEFEHSEQVIEDVSANHQRNLGRVIQFINLLFGILDGMIGLRILLKLMAANPQTVFTRIVYDFTNLFLWPFAGLTITPSVEGIVLDIPAIVALFVYALVAWSIARMVWIIFSDPAKRQVSVTERRRD
jgi:hypothetical protein